MEVLNTYIYEVKKGTKPLALVTLENEKRDKAIEKIIKSGFDYFIENVGIKSNIFFGEKTFIDVLKKIFQKNLNALSPEKDFMLGVLLGYGLEQQCERFLKFNRQDS